LIIHDETILKTYRLTQDATILIILFTHIFLFILYIFLRSIINIIMLKT